MRCEHVHKDQGYEDALCEDCYTQEELNRKAAKKHQNVSFLLPEKSK